MSTNEFGEEGIVEESVVESTPEQQDFETTSTDPTVDWKAKAEAEEGRRRRLETKLAKLSSKEDKPSKPSTSDGLDYGQKAFLIANGIKGEAEIKFAEEVMRETGKTLEQVLGSKFFQAELEERRELAKTAEATPSGKRSGSSTIDSVEYWLTKPIEDVPKEMRTQVVNARLKQEQTKGVFYNS